ncbi:MAG: hypothetical protein LBL51_05115, partial [Synergistaceae bacterium]|nr:hypothetical protein [Synergistaceae bacterium]
MRSIVAVTKEMDNAEKAVRELWAQIEAEGPLSKNGCAVVYCDVEMNHAPFVAALQKKLPFPLVGCTSISTLDRKNGTQTMAAVLCVLTADDAAFSFALTNPLTSRNLREELKSAYGKASASIGGRGKLLLLVPPFATEVAPLDVFVDILSEASGDVPVFGGLPSSSMADGDILIYAE